MLKESVDTAWCVLYTRHQHEKTVAQTLTTKGLEVFLPVYDSVRRWRDRNKILSLPLFPCYVFVRGGIARRLEVLTTPGVHMIISTGDHVATIPEEEIDAIRRAIAGPYPIEPHPFLKCGERVRIKRGALEGLEGILMRKKSLCRLILSVEAVTQSISVEIDASTVEPVTAGNNAHQLPPSPAPACVAPDRTATSLRPRVVSQRTFPPRPEESL